MGRVSPVAEADAQILPNPAIVRKTRVIVATVYRRWINIFTITVAGKEKYFLYFFRS